MRINKQITKVNRTLASRGTVPYIVIHFVGATGSAKNNADYFYAQNRNASAHFFVGHGYDVWQVVEIKDIAWHCGASSYKHPSCRNSNSIGVEMCCYKDANGRWYFTQETIDQTIELVRYLRSLGHGNAGIIRHFDVTGKMCPEPYVRDNGAWQAFLNAVNNGGTAPTPAPSAPAQPTGLPTIRSGSRGDAVRTLQNKLNAAGYNCGAIDGIFGTNTHNAVCKYQRANGLTVDGIVGSATWGKLSSVQAAPRPTAPQNNRPTYPGWLVKAGQKGETVRMIQNRLNSLGYSCGAADADFGSKTHNAVVRFQSNNGLSVDGIVGLNTWNKLF